MQADPVRTHGGELSKVIHLINRHETLAIAIASAILIVCFVDSKSVDARHQSETTSISQPGPSPERTISTGTKVFFKAGNELWVSSPDDPSLSRITEVKASGVLEIPWYNGIMGTIGESLLFGATGPSNGVENAWVSDGTNAGTRRLTNFDSLNDIFESVQVDNHIFFTVETQSERAELWVSDGTIVPVQ